MTIDHRREVSLKTCPNLPCRRRKKCLHLALQGQCLKTHYAHDDEWRDEITALLNEVNALFYDGEFVKCDPLAARSLQSMNRILDLRLRQLAFEEKHGPCVP